ncbi:MAG: M12 family metallopeptidase [Bacteroidota bacterium]|nr:M12 family metallopeptidase [Bacteroidota bacterium]
MRTFVGMTWIKKLGFSLFIVCCTICTSLPSFGQVQVCTAGVKRDNAAPERLSGKDRKGFNGVYDFQAKWKVGQVLTVAPVGNYDIVIFNKVAKYAKIWESYANVKFSFITNSDKADILIEFSDDLNSWSFIGKEALQYTSQGLPSMHFGWFNGEANEVEIKRTVLHEFGHALGLYHEHQNPTGQIAWNKNAVYAFYIENLHWSKGEIDEQVFGKYEANLTSHEYDPSSIMHYPIPAEFTTDGFYVEWNNELSQGDKSIVKSMYPSMLTAEVKKLPVMYASIQSLKFDHNVKTGFSNGLEITSDIRLENQKNKKIFLEFNFQDAETGIILIDKNGKYTASNGRVGRRITLIPQYDVTDYKQLRLDFPYSELDLDVGNYNLVCSISIYDENNKILTKGFNNYFSYGSGPNVSRIDMNSVYSDYDSSYYFYPSFSVSGGKGQELEMKIYIQNAKEEGFGYNNSIKITPLYDNTIYNEDKNGDLYFIVPKSDWNRYSNALSQLRIDVFYKNKVLATMSMMQPFEYDK